MSVSIIFGAGAMGKTLYPKIEQKFGGEYDKLYFTDSNPILWGTSLFGKPIINPQEILQMEYDRIIITTLSGYETIPEKLTSELAVPFEKIYTGFIDEMYERTFNTRNRFLKRFAELVREKNLDGNVAEGGVFEGYFAKRINAEFPNKTLYLFDTFEGFDKRDIVVEKADTRNRVKHFNMDMKAADILSRMPYPENIEIRKGYFPETTDGIDDKFVFVNLDFDLYQPTLAGLEFFYPKMTGGGGQFWFTIIFKILL